MTKEESGRDAQPQHDHDEEERGAPCEGVRGLSDRARDEPERFLGCPRDKRDDDDRQRKRSGDCAEHDAGEGDLKGGEDEQTHDDGREARHDVGEESDGEDQRALPVFGEVDPRKEPKRNRDSGREPEQEERPDDRIADAALRARDVRSRRAGDWLDLREELRVDHGGSAHDDGVHDAPEGNERESNGGERQHRHEPVFEPPSNVPTESDHSSPPSRFPRNRQTMKRAKTLMRKATSMRTRPSSTMAPNSRLPAAPSRALFAMMLESG